MEGGDGGRNTVVGGACGHERVNGGVLAGDFAA